MTGYWQNAVYEDATGSGDSPILILIALLAALGAFYLGVHSLAGGFA